MFLILLTVFEKLYDFSGFRESYRVLLVAMVGFGMLVGSLVGYFVILSTGRSWIDDKIVENIDFSGSLSFWASGHLGFRASGHLALWESNIKGN